jgi:hypothetical protein
VTIRCLPNASDSRLVGKAAAKLEESFFQEDKDANRLLWIRLKSTKNSLRRSGHSFGEDGLSSSERTGRQKDALHSRLFRDRNYANPPNAVDLDRSFCLIASFGEVFFLVPRVWGWNRLSYKVLIQDEARPFPVIHFSNTNGHECARDWALFERCWTCWRISWSAIIISVAFGKLCKILSIIIAVRRLIF